MYDVHNTISEDFVIVRRNDCPKETMCAARNVVASGEIVIRRARQQLHTAIAGAVQTVQETGRMIYEDLIHLSTLHMSTEHGLHCYA